ncbi:MAG TPA: hypothetical protein VHO02_02220 [Fibrobacteria bacterium]|jgi:hypothetical protein|nr:hypothetical protein [Fibrobacteria bacterium]
MNFKTLLIGTAALGATVLTGCMTDSGRKSAPDNAPAAYISVFPNVKGVNGLSKTASVPTGIVLKKLIVTMTSSVGTDAVLRDTVLADTGAFSSNSAVAQAFSKQYQVKSLRSWTVQVKTLDARDSVIHIASQTASNLTVGETRALTFNLKARFTVYAAKFVLPDSLASSDPGVTMKQALYVNRFMMVIGGDTVRDSTALAGGYFAKSPAEHYLLWNYVDTTVGKKVALYVFADSTRMNDSTPGGWKWPKNKPIFGDSIVVTKIDSVYAPKLPWSGPGSSSDPDGNGGGSKVGLSINIGAVSRVDINTDLGGLPKRKED